MFQEVKHNRMDALIIYTFAATRDGESGSHKSLIAGGLLVELFAILALCPISLGKRC